MNLTFDQAGPKTIVIYAKTPNGLPGTSNLVYALLSFWSKTTSTEIICKVQAPVHLTFDPENLNNL